jgi:hypothetical protein
VSYIDPDILTDEGAIAEAKIAGVADRVDGWDPHNADVEVAIIEADSSIDAALGTLIKDEARDVHGGFGRNILGLQRHAAHVASGTATFTLAHTRGGVISDGFELVMETPAGDAVAFATVGETDVPLDVDTVRAVPIVALETGPAANGLSGTPRDIDDDGFVDSVVVDESTSDGAEEEPLVDWNDRIIRRARRMKVVAITLDDYADIPLDIDGIARCAAINNYRPDSPDDESPGHVTIVPLDATGLASSPTIALAAKTLLEGEDRALQIMVHTAPPWDTAFDVAMEIRLALGADPDTTRSAVAAAIQDAYSRARYGLDARAPGRWRVSAEPIRDYDVAVIAKSVIGCDGVVDVTFDDGVRRDLREISLAGWVPLPALGTVTVTIEGA